MKQKLYIMKNEFDLIKIGISNNPYKRANKISRVSGVGTTLINEYETERPASKIEAIVQIAIDELKKHEEAQRLAASKLQNKNKPKNTINDGVVRSIWFFRTPKIMAKKLGISPQVVCNWRNGKAKVSAYHAIRIERATKGEITIDDLIDVEEVV